MFLREISEKIWDTRVLAIVSIGREQCIEGERSSGSSEAEIGHIIKDGMCTIEHVGVGIGNDDSGEVRFLIYIGSVLHLFFQQGFDLGEFAVLNKMLHLRVDGEEFGLGFPRFSDDSGREWTEMTEEVVEMAGRGVMGDRHFLSGENWGLLGFFNKRRRRIKRRRKS